MKIFGRLLIFVLVIAISLMFYFGSHRSPPVRGAPSPQKPPDLTAMFYGNGNYQQWVDRFGTVSRSAFDAAGNRIGTQVGHVGGPHGIVVEMTYLLPDADHPLGQAFDGQGKPMRLDTGPDQPIDRTEQGPLVS